jgi:plastocyanin
MTLHWRTSFRWLLKKGADRSVPARMWLNWRGCWGVDRAVCPLFHQLLSLVPLCCLLATALVAGAVTGKVELRDSRDPAVRNRQDYSGVVISLTPIQGDAGLPPSNKHAVILQKNKAFSPHVLAIPAGSFVDFPNLDPIFHNAFSSYSGQVFDIGLYPPGTSRSVRFTREGVVRVFCNIHSSMSAMIVVLATPYFTVTKHDGSFTLPDVPPGEYKVRIVHERASEAALQTLTRSITVRTEALAFPVFSISEAGYLSIPHKNKFGQDYVPDAGDHVMYPATRK